MLKKCLLGLAFVRIIDHVFFLFLIEKMEDRFRTGLGRLCLWRCASGVEDAGMDLEYFRTGIISLGRPFSTRGVFKLSSVSMEFLFDDFLLVGRSSFLALTSPNIIAANNNMKNMVLIGLKKLILQFIRSLFIYVLIVWFWFLTHVTSSGFLVQLTK